jgi:TolB-like protein
MNHHFRIVSLLVLLVGLAGAQTPVASSVNLFILSFDNYRSDPEVDWLKEGFVDFLLDYFRTKPGVAAHATARMEATLDKIDREPS